MSDQSTHPCAEFKQTLAALLALIRLDAPREVLLAGVERVETQFTVSGFTHGKVMELLEDIKESRYDADQAVTNLTAIVISMTPERELGTDWIRNSPAAASPLLWLTHIKAMVSTYSDTTKRTKYPMLLGCMRLLYECFVSNGMIAAAEAFKPYVELCCSSPRDGLLWCAQWIDALSAAACHLSDDEEVVATLEKTVASEQSGMYFKRLISSPVRLSAHPGVLVVMPEDYTAEERTYVERSLCMFLMGHSSISFVKEKDPVPEDTPSTFLRWPGRCALLRPFDPRAVRRFMLGGSLDMDAPCWMRREDGADRVVVPYEEAGIPSLERREYIPTIDRPVGGRMSSKLEMSTIIAWIPGAFDYLLDKLNTDLTYNASPGYATQSGSNCMTIQQIAAASPATAFLVRNQCFGMPLGCSVRKCVNPEILLLVSDMDAEELAYVKAGLSRNMLNFSSITEVRDTYAEVTPSTDAVVLWPPRTIPIRTIDANNCYALAKEISTGIYSIDADAPQWCSSEALKAFTDGIGDNPLDEDAEFWIAKDCIADIHGMVFGRTARQLEVMDIARWEKGTMRHLAAVMNEAFNYIHAL